MNVLCYVNDLNLDLMLVECCGWKWMRLIRRPFHVSWISMLYCCSSEKNGILLLCEYLKYILTKSLSAFFSTIWSRWLTKHTQRDIEKVYKKNHEIGLSVNWVCRDITRTATKSSIPIIQWCESKHCQLKTMLSKKKHEIDSLNAQNQSNHMVIRI